MEYLFKQLASLVQDFPDHVEAIRREEESFKAALKSAEDENRELIIAIVGRVKSGKSSFLNALLFNGENVLPQAATPMTAALTFIRFDTRCHAEVEFFPEGDWRNFEQKAVNYEKIREQIRQSLEKEEEEAERRAKRSMRKYVRREVTEERINEKIRKQLGEETLAAVELVRMASEVNIDSGAQLDVHEYLGKKRCIEGSSPQELALKLQDYVGSKGYFTPIVCSTTIFINDPGLEGYCVIDTPGTNDPVISRGKKTQDNLKKADVVFVMSPAGRFFDDSDLRLCSQNLPANGIKDFVILISQFDMVIGEIEGKIDRSLSPDVRMNMAMRKARTDLISRFHQCISGIVQRAVASNNADKEKWRRLLKEDPILVSAKAYILARHWEVMDAKEKEYLEKFNTLIPGFLFNREDLYDFSMMNSVHDRLNKVKACKNNILTQRKSELAVAARKRINEMLADLKAFVKSQIEVLESADIAKLTTELSAQTMRIERGRMGLEDVFKEAIHTAHDKFNDILCEIREAKSRYARVNVESETYQSFYKQQVYRGGLGIIDALLGPQEVIRYYTYETKYVNIYQVVEQVEAFADKARRLLEHGIRSAVNIKALQKKIVNVIFTLLEGEDEENCDINLLKVQIKRAVRGVQIPDSDFGDVNYAEFITAYFFGGRVEEEEIEALKVSQCAALQNVVSDLESRAQEKVSAIEHSLKSAMETFADNLIGDLKKSNELLATSIKDRVAVCKRWKSYLSTLDKLCLP